MGVGVVSTSRQRNELIRALDLARRAAGRYESRCRLAGDHFGVRLARNERATLAGMSEVQQLRPHLTEAA